MDMDLFQQMLRLTLHRFEENLERHVPPGAYRDFCLWMLRTDSPLRQQWLELMGIPQIIRLNLMLLSELVERDAWGTLTERMAPMNIYQIYEVISDNLAIGLATPHPGDAKHPYRKRLLQAFNQVMMQHLRGAPESPAELLAPLRSEAEQLSIFEQSLSPQKYRTLVQAYCTHTGQAVAEHLERSVWHGLVANIQSSGELARTMAPHTVGPLVVQGLLNRYQGVNRLLEDPWMPLSRRIHLGVDTILGEPTLAYCIGVVAEMAHQLPGLRKAVEDGLLSEALYHSSLQVRLLNDMGTPLLEQSAEERTALIQSLAAGPMPPGPPTLSTLLLGARGEHALVLTRLHKDLRHGEFNTGLHGLLDLPVSEGLEMLLHRLARISEVYQQSVHRLRAVLEQLSEQFDYPGVSQPILRFVRFHERLYSQSHEGQEGEYAV